MAHFRQHSWPRYISEGGIDIVHHMLFPLESRTLDGPFWHIALGYLLPLRQRVILYITYTSPVMPKEQLLFGRATAKMSNEAESRCLAEARSAEKQQNTLAFLPPE